MMKFMFQTSTIKYLLFDREIYIFVVFKAGKKSILEVCTKQMTSIDFELQRRKKQKDKFQFATETIASLSNLSLYLYPFCSTSTISPVSNFSPSTFMTA